MEDEKKEKQELIDMLRKVVDQAKISGYKENSRRLFGKDDFTAVVNDAEEMLKKYLS
ncbi:MAG: hypothetical protein K0R18_279 [Bacillales bacterium]|jgi:hypothetical protein|nr:hypothetical protein [Bacillales bacterium]